MNSDRANPFRASMLLVLFALGAGGACDCGALAGVDGGDDDDGGVDACQRVAFGDITLDERQDTQTIYSAPLETELGLGVGDYLVFNFINYNERFGALAVGTFPLDEAPNDNRGPCAECISIFEDQLTVNSAPQAVFFQSQGTIRVDSDPRTGRFRARVEGLVLVEVTIDGATLESTPVEGGRCIRTEDFDVDYLFVPEDWTCDVSLFDSGGICNCNCGAPDPDCSCDPFRNPDCPAVIENDCPADTVCTATGCEAGCNPFSVPTTPCADAGELCAFGEGGSSCIDESGRVNAAALDAPCLGLGNLVQYCAVVDTVPAGVCDDISGLCLPICGPERSCSDSQECYTIANGGPETGFGFCPQGGGDEE